MLLSNGSVRLRSATGAERGTIDVGDVRAIALDGATLVVLTRQNTLDVFDTQTGDRLNSWKVPTGVRATVDAHFGVAVLTRKGTVHAVSLSTGRSAVVGTTVAPAIAAIEAPGVTFASSRGSGVVRPAPPQPDRPLRWSAS